MLKHLFVLFIFMIALQIEASVNQEFEKRTEWVNELKSFLFDLESKNPNLLTQSERSLLNRFAVFDEAIASGNYECFFAGWPSKLIKSGGKKVCQSPSRGNTEYQAGICKTGELQCQPMIFGKGLCVGFSGQKDKQVAFANCESKFKKNGSYDFLKTMSADDKATLKEISVLAHKICVTGTVGIQKSKPMCKSLINKFKDGIVAIDRAPALSVNEIVPEGIIKTKTSENELPDLIPLITAPLPKVEEVCNEPLVDDKNVEVETGKTFQAVNENADSTYDELKKDFLSSALCEPDKVLNDPKEKLSPILFNQLLEDMRFIVKTETYLTREVKLLRFKEVAEDYGISAETIKYGEGLLNTFVDTAPGRFEAMARLRGVMLQEMDKISKNTPSYKAEIIKEELLKRKIFTQDADGYPQCPFVSEIAFQEALAGREAVMKSGHKNEITDPNVITIVDYSRPSYERRMFVIDIKSKKVLHNTWVGHGGGKDRSQEAGIDKLGSSPQTSNAAGSFLSSEGFYIAKAASSGGTYLNNVTLNGIDVNNKAMGGRAIVVHGWRTPNHEYVNKTWVISADKKRTTGVDIYKNFMEIDFKNTKEDLFDITQELSSASSARDRLDATDGCLGVPDTQMGHADRRGRHKSQLELLREDLPGTLMFNYTGPGKTKSQYLK
jgi:hypothetical protein